MKKFTLLSITLLFIAGCNGNTDSGSSSQSSTRLITTTYTTPTKPVKKPATIKTPSPAETKITLTTIEAKHKEQLATIAAEKETKIRQMELEQIKVENQARQTITKREQENKITLEKMRQKHALVQAKEDAELYQLYLMVGTAILIVVLLFIFFIHRRNQKLTLKLHDDELQHESFMQSSKQHHERITKTLEILADETTDKNLKKELIKLLKEQNSQQPKLLGR